MDVDVVDFADRHSYNGDIKLPGIAQHTLDDTLQQDNNEFGRSSEMVPPDRSVREKLGQRVLSALIKIVIFSDTVLKRLIPDCLSKFFATVDIETIESENEESLFEGIKSEHKITHFIIIKSSQYAKRLIDRMHSHDNVNTIYIYCDSNELKSQRRLARNYPRLNAVFDDPRQILIKLLMDIALFCEELADRQKHEPSSLQFAYKNYQRSVDLYGYAERMV